MKYTACKADRQTTELLTYPIMVSAATVHVAQHLLDHVLVQSAHCSREDPNSVCVAALAHTRGRR